MWLLFVFKSWNNSDMFERVNDCEREINIILVRFVIILVEWRRLSLKVTFDL